MNSFAELAKLEKRVTKLEQSQNKLYYYEVLTKSSSLGYFSGYVLETDLGWVDFWNEDFGDALFYNTKAEFLKDMEGKEGKENFKLVEL